MYTFFINKLPNILYIHSHDTGRYVQPYGFPVPTPNIQLLADQGVLFRNAFCAAPTCSGSRASLLTGQYCHNNGLLGLAHRGWELNDYGQHLVHPLREAGYRSVLIGEQHISE
ncbi:MAG TPA: sulfatase-like hydrolase/transferase, partial [Solirubrobacterales bacterium]|nr:sulfatase-like hydrolase/transferase [Solirubrobacterales bacterium]